METTYLRRSTVREQQVGGERMLFDDGGDMVHVLNGSAAFIWDCLKTPSTVARIEAALRAEYDLRSVADVPGMIGRILGDFACKKLIDAAPDAS